MSPNSVPHSKLRTAFRWLAISLTTIIATWFVVIVWWQTTQRVVTTGDAILYLAVLPLAVLLGIGLLRWRLSTREERARVPSASPEASAATVADDATVQETKKIPILAAWAVTSVAHDTDELIENLMERRSRPTPDDLLTDSNGFPLLTGRVKDLDTNAVADLLPQAHTETAEGDMRDTLLRSLALIESVLHQTAQDWPLPVAVAANRPMQEANIPTLRGAVGAQTAAPLPLALRVTLLISNQLDPWERQQAQAYVAKRLVMLGISDRELPIDIAMTEDDATALRLAGEFGNDAAGESIPSRPQALLMLACDSALCPSIADLWGDQGRLFDTRRPQGIMMGESAFGVLFANEKAVQDIGASPICHLAPVAGTQADPNVDARTAHQRLGGAISAALAAARISGDAIGTVVCDADHRTSRTLESIEAMLEQTPRLDAIQNRLAVNEACGHLGAASALGVLATGATQAASAGHPVLIFNVSHASERIAAVLLPADGEPDLSQEQHLEAA